MTAVSTAPSRVALPTRRWPGAVGGRDVLPPLFALLNGVAFVVLRPGVNDLWAARARASAAAHGVGLTYWFSWFGGGSTPGNYSVLTPYLCAAIGTELVGALSAVGATVLAVIAVHGTQHPVLASWVAAIAAVTNLWSGRVPFLLGSAIGVGAIIAVRRGRRAAAVGLTLLSILASPVSGAFIAMGLSGTFITTRTRAYRPIIGWTVGAAAIALVGVAVLFGAPGPEPFAGGRVAEAVLGLLVFWLAWPGDHIRTLLGTTLFATAVLATVPNGMGSNFARFIYFCLPVVVVALSGRRARTALVAVLPVLVIGALDTGKDLIHAANPISSVGYYSSLARELDRIPETRNYRVEVVNHGSHAGYDALLDHALLARGWETQEDVALNSSLNQQRLDAVTYKVWLDNNAVGYVALPASSVGGYPEYTLVETGRAPYLHRVWRNSDWQLFAVADPTPMVAAPGWVVGHDQKSMTIQVPCVCTVAVRVRWSKFLTATLQQPGPGVGEFVDVRPRMHARLRDDGDGWTTLSTRAAGTYTLRGSLRGGLFRGP